MSIANFGDLKSAVKSWIKRTELSDGVVADFITLAQSDINARLRIRAMETRDSAFSVSSEYTALPTRFRELRSVTMMTDPSVALELVSPQWSANAYNQAETGRPRFYNVEGSNLRLVPAPDSTYTLELIYYAGFAAFSADADTDDLLTNNPDVYLFGALKESAPFIGHDERTQLWTAKYEGALARVQREDRKTNWSGSQSGMRVKFAP